MQYVDAAFVGCTGSGSADTRADSFSADMSQTLNPAERLNPGFPCNQYSLSYQHLVDTFFSKQLSEGVRRISDKTSYVSGTLGAIRREPAMSR